MKIEIICESCGKKFLREKGEITRNKKKGRRAYCSLSCVGKAHHKHLEEYQDNLVPGNANSKTDDLSPFRHTMKCITNKDARRKRKPCKVTLEDIKKQWEKQKGICPYTGWKLKLRQSMGNKARLDLTPDRASLDRIDSSKPYTKDNIHFVAMIAQFAKNKWEEKELLKFCKAVVEHTTLG